MGTVDDKLAPTRPRTAVSHPRASAWWCLWASAAVSGVGDGMFAGAFPLLAAAVTRDPALIGGVVATLNVPLLVFSLPAGGVADRLDRRRLMVGADLAAGLVTAGLALAVWQHRDAVWLLFMTAFMLGGAQATFDSASSATVPSTVPRASLPKANAQLAAASVSTESFAGPPAGAALYGAAAAVPFAADAASFFASAVLVSRLPRSTPPGRTDRTSLSHDIGEGVRWLVGHPYLRTLAVLLAAVNFFGFAALGVLVLFALQDLHTGRIGYAVVLVALAGGELAAQIAVVRIRRRFGARTTIVAAFWLWAIGTVALAVAHQLSLGAIALAIVGAGDGLWQVTVTTLRQQLSPPELLGRTSSVFRFIGHGVIPLGAAAGGGMAALWGVRLPFLVAAGALLCIAVLAPLLLPPDRSLPALDGPSR